MPDQEAFNQFDLGRRTVPVSKMRRAGIIYLDFLAGSSIAYVAGTFLEVDKYHWPLAFGIWVGLEFMLHQPFGRSFGRYALGVVHTESGEMVDADLAERQHGLLVALGILTVLSASKLVARGFSDYTFFYLADQRFTSLEGRLMWITLAAAYVWSATWLFRMRRYAPRNDGCYVVCPGQRWHES
ncbi:MAG TPA: hypothetical protein VM056_07500 [Terriglobales bacterium]|nr:hypothetical protein [Terriglobales bacterium]